MILNLISGLETHSHITLMKNIVDMNFCSIQIKLKNRQSTSQVTSLGSLSSVGVFTGGSGYQVNDRLTFRV